NSSSLFNNQQSGSSGSERRRSSRRSSRTSQNDGLNGMGATAPTTNRSISKTAPSGGGAPAGGGSGSPGQSANLSILGGASGANGAPAKKAAPSAVNIRPVNVLYLVTKSNIMKVNEPFSVDVKLSMPQAEGYDSLAFKLSYDPEVVMPIQGALEDGEWAPANAMQYIMTEPDRAPVSTKDIPNTIFSDLSDAGRILTNEVNPQTGEIQFETSAQAFTKSGSYFIASLMFVPLRPAEESSIQFEFQPMDEGRGRLSTHLVVKDKDGLGSSGNLMDGVVPLHFSVQDPNQPFANSNRITSSLDASSLDESAKRPAQLVLQIDEDAIETGDTFNLIVSLSNPDQRSIDEINVFLLYNPSVMQAVNGRGVLASNGGEYEMLPFDFTTHQEINAEKGVIDIRKRSSRSAVRDSGVCAVIPFRALKPTTKTTLRILIDGKGKAPTTGAFYKSRDALGDQMNPGDGCFTTSVSIRPTAAYMENVSAKNARS
ncbi:hypothetical protein K8I31_16180, partial [bacterium]|nr:hypothetical protein [bacterium]